MLVAAPEVDQKTAEAVIAAAERQKAVFDALGFGPSTKTPYARVYRSSIWIAEAIRNYDKYDVWYGEASATTAVKSGWWMR